MTFLLFWVILAGAWAPASHGCPCGGPPASHAHSSSPAPATSPSGGGGTTTSYALAGDAEFAGLRYAAAVERYDSACATGPDSAQYLWRLARLHVCIGDITPREGKEQEYRAAAGYAERCIRADSTIAAGHTWKAAALGNIAMFEGSKGKVRLCNEIKSELDRALALDTLDDIAWSIRGSFYRALGKVSWIERQLAAVFLGSLPDGGLADAEAALHRATSIAPGVIRHWYELAMVYHDEGKNAEAIEAFGVVTRLPSLVGSDDRVRSRARDWIENLKNE